MTWHFQPLAALRLPPDRPRIDRDASSQAVIATDVQRRKAFAAIPAGPRSPAAGPRLCLLLSGFAPPELGQPRHRLDHSTGLVLVGVCLSGVDHNSFPH